MFPPAPLRHTPPDPMNAPAPAAPPLLDVLAACDYLGVSERTIRRHTAPNGPLIPTRIGRRVLYSPAALDRYVAERETAAVADAAGPDLPR